MTDLRKKPMVTGYVSPHIKGKIDDLISSGKFASESDLVNFAITNLITQLEYRERIPSPVDISKDEKALLDNPILIFADYIKEIIEKPDDEKTKLFIEILTADKIMTKLRNEIRIKTKTLLKASGVEYKGKKLTYDGLLGELRKEKRRKFRLF